jgi:site-specific recombinase XerC
MWTDISASKVQRYLAELRKRENGISAQTYNYYLQSIKQFCRWMVQDSRASESPLEHLKRINTQTDKRHSRRALEPDEIRRLLEVTEAAPMRFGMTGGQRAVLYRLAVETGLRAKELRSLKVSSFNLNDCTVTVEAAYSKNRRQSTLPLRKDTAAQFKSFLTGKMPGVQYAR